VGFKIVSMEIKDLENILVKEAVDSKQREYASILIGQIKTCFELINQINDDFLSDKKHDFKHHMMKISLQALIRREGNNQSPKQIVFLILADYVNNIADFLRAGTKLNADYARQLNDLITDLTTICDET